jgi:hypothetical protein
LPEEHRESPRLTRAHAVGMREPGSPNISPNISQDERYVFLAKRQRVIDLEVASGDAEAAKARELFP